ncbi:(Fe-S)-binding protein [Acidiplasma aeolicum]|uniref:(Fe-S)-binding protein n=1 Tax=Acidiplasma aeolicum TaxID=507754 RepID=UPI0009FFA132|nr:(Fe-S)-binding protein [Acidiplasma aeolicum]
MTEFEKILNDLKNESSKCISCGFCDSVCPTYKSSGYDMAKTARGRAQTGLNVFREITLNDLSLNVSDTFYSCLDCHVCLQVCPTGVDAGKISDIVKAIIYEKYKKLQKPEVNLIIENIKKYKSPVPLKKVSYEWLGHIKYGRSDTLLYTGLMYQLMPYTENMERMRKKLGNKLFHIMISMASVIPVFSRFGRPDKRMLDRTNNTLIHIVELLNKSGISFDVLGYNEPYPGTLLYDYGYINDFKDYITGVYNILKNYKKVITVDPHTYNILRYEYKKYIPDFNIDVYYYTDFLNKSMFTNSGKTVAFHDPCHFQGNTEYNGAINIISSVAKAVKPERNSNLTYCCGGPDELLYPDLSMNISKNRYNQLIEKSQNIITACPICSYSLSRNGNVNDLADFLVKCIK